MRLAICARARQPASAAAACLCKLGLCTLSTWTARLTVIQVGPAPRPGPQPAAWLPQAGPALTTPACDCRQLHAAHFVQWRAQPAAPAPSVRAAPTVRRGPVERAGQLTPPCARMLAQGQATAAATPAGAAAAPLPARLCNRPEVPRPQHGVVAAGHRRVGLPPDRVSAGLHPAAPGQPGKPVGAPLTAPACVPCSLSMDCSGVGGVVKKFAVEVRWWPRPCSALAHCTLTACRCLPCRERSASICELGQPHVAISTASATPTRAARG